MLQEQVKEPALFVHVCEQPPLLVAHSLISGHLEENYTQVIINKDQIWQHKANLLPHFKQPIIKKCLKGSQKVNSVTS